MKVIYTYVCTNEQCEELNKEVDILKERKDDSSPECKCCSNKMKKILSVSDHKKTHSSWSNW